MLTLLSERKVFHMSKVVFMQFDLSLGNAKRWKESSAAAEAQNAGNQLRLCELQCNWEPLARSTVKIRGCGATLSFLLIIYMKV